MAATLEPRRLRGHKSTVTCCIPSRDRPGIVATAGEDGWVCLFDMRCKDAQLVAEVGEQPISSLCFKTGNEDFIYVSSACEVNCFDMRMATPWKPLKSYNYNKEEINQIVCNGKASFLASTDDSGDVKVIDIGQHCLYKTLRAGHSSICCAAQFIPWKPWEVVTGGLDSKLILWDFSKGRPIKVVDYGMPDTRRGSNAGQCVNPAFVHAIAVPDIDMIDKTGKVCAVARGDGIVDIIDIESELGLTKSKSSSKGKKTSQTTGKAEPSGQNERRRSHLDYTVGGHGAAVSSVAFSLFAEKGKFIVSGGNDKLVKVWEITKVCDSTQTGDNVEILRLNINLSKKVNWLCTTPAESENLVVCDTTKVVKVYSVS